ncbi:unnamed protein product [Blepharisma stoltei]|uniref:Uncharacterized protein n=1 Tax=Blepharisma stoltei TaxID=1481888 RepID=A0AAU9JKN4_9CILI|nr:unnamed protein product [Blepharisma stoltei]
MINTLHLYAYCNYPNNLKKALKNSSSMINSVFNQNPLSIAILKGFKNCINSIILSLDNYLVVHIYTNSESLRLGGKPSKSNTYS